MLTSAASFTRTALLRSRPRPGSRPLPVRARKPPSANVLSRLGCEVCTALHEAIHYWAACATHLQRDGFRERCAAQQQVIVGGTDPAQHAALASTLLSAVNGIRCIATCSLCASSPPDRCPLRLRSRTSFGCPSPLSPLLCPPAISCSPAHTVRHAC